MPNLSWIAQKHFSNLAPRQINSGNCYNWAYIAYLKYDNVKLLTLNDYGGHAFVKIGRYYYDAQNPFGVLHWSSLDMLRELCRDDIYTINPWRQSPQAFLKYWREYGKHPFIDIGKLCL